MIDLTRHPLLIFALSFVVLLLSELIGSSILKRHRKLEEEVREDFSMILSATLTLLGLLIGFSFSMALGRYDQATSQPTPVLALVISGINDVLNSQGYTQAAWWNRIPIEAWGMMVGIAICANLLVGYGVRKAQGVLLFVLPLMISLAFLLIADIDSPGGGIILVRPQNLESLVQSLR